MSDPSRPADADRVTTTATTHQAEQQGRFGRTSLRGAEALESETRTDQVDQMRNLIQRAGYRVDANAVADAIIARLKGGRHRQRRCSKPFQPWAPAGALTHRRPGAPTPTSPIQVSPAASPAARAAGGTQAHSS